MKDSSLNKILYIANVRMPTDKAHGVQIMKASEAFANEGAEVILCVTDRRTPISEDPFLYYEVRHNFKLIRLHVFDTLKFGKWGFIFESLSFGIQALRMARKYPGHLIYSRDEIALFPILLLSKRACIWESHDGIWNFTARFVAKRVRGMVVVSKGLSNFYVEQGIPKERICAVSNGVDLEIFASTPNTGDSRAKLGLPAGVKIALYIGRLDGWKGVDTLLNAIEFLPTDIKVALIGGDHSQVEELSARYKEALFLGFRPYNELPANQVAADVLIIPNTGKNNISVNFTSPLKLLAHMASGKPIIASDLPSIREISGSDTVKYVPADDPKALALAIIEVCSNTELGEMYARKAKERVRALDWSHRAQVILFHLKNLSCIL